MGAKSDGGQAAALQAQVDEMRKAREALGAVSEPDYDLIQQYLEQQALQSPELVGELTPEELAETALADIATDPRLRQAQMDELGAYDEILEKGGM